MNRPSPIFVLLAISVFVYHFGAGFYSFMGERPPESFEFLYGVAFLCGAVWWLKREAQDHLFDRFYCPSMVVGVGWFVSIPYYLFKARGWRGFIPISVIIGCVVAGNLLGGLTLFLLITR